EASWHNSNAGPDDPRVTIEAYFALKLAGIAADQPEMVRARDFILAHGGIGGVRSDGRPSVRIFTKLWLSLFGQFDWNALPAMPPEAIVLPDRFPFNIYEFASWARATIVAILVVSARKPVAAIDPAHAGDELYAKSE